METDGENRPGEPKKSKRGTRATDYRSADRARKDRLHQMIELAQTYLGCSKAQLAAALNRDPAKVAPDSGNPKLDMVMGLSDILDWPAGDVAEALWHDPLEDDAGANEPLPDKTFVELNKEAIEAHRAGDHQLMRKIASQMLRIAKEPRERGIAMNRLAGSYDVAGRYGKALEWARAAVSEAGVPANAHLLYQANLASLNFAVWNLHEAVGLAERVLSQQPQIMADDTVSIVARSIASYVCGNAQRRLMAQLPEQCSQLGARALLSLDRAIVDLKVLADRNSDERYLGIANTCLGAKAEVSVRLGTLAPANAVAQLFAGLETVVDPTTHPRGDWLESWGWWAVFGLNIAIDFLTGDDRQRHAAVFSTKAHEIADRLNNWAIRERAFSLEHDWRSGTPVSQGSEETSWMLDREDLRTLVGTMGRFPSFRRTGWRILRCATLI